MKLFQVSGGKISKAGVVLPSFIRVDGRVMAFIAQTQTRPGYRGYNYITVGLTGVTLGTGPKPDIIDVKDGEKVAVLAQDSWRGNRLIKVEYEVAA